MQKNTNRSFLSKTNVQFINVYDNSGIDKQAHTGGVSWVDFNNDGFDDLFMGGGVGGSKLYRNVSGKHFIDATPRVFNSLASLLIGLFADYDNDGCQDVFIGEATIGDKLFHGDCKGGFTEVTRMAMINENIIGTMGVAAADYDRDGYLDIYVSKYGYPKDDGYVTQTNILYKNNGNGSFTDVTISSQVSGFSTCHFNGLPPTLERFTKRKASFQPVWFDYNNDTWSDLFVATDFNASVLYKNNGDGTFSDVTNEAGMCRWATGMGAAVGDYNQDGWFDIYQTNVGRNFLWKNNGNGTFAEVSREAGITGDKYIGWGTGFMDYDNDGNNDIYVVNGTILRIYSEIARDEEFKKFQKTQENIGIIQEDKFYRNMGNGKFSDVTKRSGISGDSNKNAGAFSDYNNDGYTDIFISPNYYEDEANYKLYQNIPKDNNWVTIKLIGTKSNKDSVGSRVIISAGGKKQIREVGAGSSYLSQNSFRQSFGLGKASIIEKIEVKWPSGLNKTLYNVKSNQSVNIVEPGL